MGADFFSDYSSRLKHVYIKLYNYSFFHNPTEIGNKDDRFIGRRDITERLKTILSNNSTRSGAYLITGNRGMGKSSYVNYALNEICACQKPMLICEKLLRIFVVVIFLSLFDFDFLDGIEGMIGFCLFLASLFIIAGKKIKKENLPNQISAPLILRHFSDLFIKLLVNTQPVSRWSQLFLELGSVSIVIWTGVYCRTCSGGYSRLVTNLQVFFTCILIIIAVRLFAVFKFPLDDIKPDDGIYPFFKRIGTKTIKWLKNYVNFSRRVYCKINLGFDDLKETDILKLIARNLKQQYGDYYYFSRKNWIWKMSYLLGLYIVSVALYYNEPFQGINGKFKNDFYISGIPSQNITDYNYYLKSDTSSLFKRNNKNSFYTAYFNSAKSKSADLDISPLVTDSSRYIMLFNLLAYSDFYVNYAYNTVLSFVPFFSNNKYPFFIPAHLEYLFIFYYLLLLFVIKNILKLKIFSGYTHYYIYSKIKFLNDQIDSQISMETSSGVNWGNSGNLLSILFGKKKTKSYPVADVREIEKSLIEILEEINRLPSHIIKPEFIIIFDELDKIEPYFNSSADEKLEGKNSTSKYSQNVLFSPEGTRQRQNTILKLMSNLKFFLTTAKAKFIFIAGREMYDAYLADVSDRNYFIGSIFHDVINVDSFLSESYYGEKKIADVSYYAEQYVCKYLIPEYYLLTKPIPRTEWYTLRAYNSFLKEKYAELNEDAAGSYASKIIARQKREKIITTVQHLIIYLTHRSNGAPKKITTLFESFIVKYKTLSIFSSECAEFNLSVGCNEGDFALSFGYYAQYRIGIINYLINPILLSINTIVKDYSDKLTVSATFLIDHLFKFHRSGFSWRNLEIMPEIIDINKSPELRNFIDDIMKFLTQTHLQEIISGFYNYMFPKKISEELSFVSKISERESAAFNFSLDESLALKNYYRNNLCKLEQKYNISFLAEMKSGYIHSVSSMHVILGDLHFYDGEYNDAIQEYMESVQILRRIEIERLTASDLVVLVRNMLKLGLAYEKRKTYESAFVTYCELAEKLIYKRDIDLGEFGLHEQIIEDEFKALTNSCDKNKHSGTYKALSTVVNQAKDKEKILYKEFIPPLGDGGVFPNRYKNTKSAEFMSNILDYFTPLKEKLISKISTFESVRLLSQPIIAKFQIIEKMHVSGGISMSDINRVLAEIDYLTKVMKQDERFLYKGECRKKIADVLFFKNGNISLSNSEKDVFNPFSPKEHNEAYIIPLSCSKNRDKLLKGRKKIPCVACKIYDEAFCTVLESIIEKKQYTTPGEDQSIKWSVLNPFERIQMIFEAIEQNIFVTQRDTALITLAGLLSDQGDVYFSCSGEDTGLSMDFLNKFIELLGERGEYDKKNKIINDLITAEYNTRITCALLYFYTSGIFYKKSNKYKDYSVQLTKILYVINEYTPIRTEIAVQAWSVKTRKNVFMEKLEGNILRKAILSIYGAYEGINFAEIKKMQKIFSPFNASNSNTTGKLNISLKDLSLNPDIEEMTYLYKRLELNIIPDTDDSIMQFFELMKNNVVSPYSVNESMYNRIIKLRYKVLLNHKIFSYFIDESQGLSIQLISLFWLQSQYKDSDIIGAPDIMEKKEAIIGEVKTAYRCKSEDSNIEKAFIYKIDKYCSGIYYFNKVFKEPLNIKDLLENLITDSIFSLSEILRLNSIYGTSYMLPHSFTGKQHQKMMKWCKYFSEYREFFGKIGSEQKGESDNAYYLSKMLLNWVIETPSRSDEEKKIPQSNELMSTKIYEKLKDVIENESMRMISEEYHAQKGIKRLHSAIETHIEGKAYRELIDNMFYFNDDFNDKFSHFFAARERYEINCGMINKRIKQMKPCLDKSVFIEPENNICTIV